MSNSSPNFLRLVRVAFYDPFQTPEKGEYKSLTRLQRFVGPFITSVGGTVKARPQIAASLSGGGFSIHMERDPYQITAVDDYLEEWVPDGHRYEGLIK